MAIPGTAHLFLYFSHLHKKKKKKRCVCLLQHLSWSTIKYLIFFIPIILTNGAPIYFLELQSSTKITDPLTTEMFSVLQIHVKKPKYLWNIGTLEKMHIAIIKLAFSYVHLLTWAQQWQVIVWENTGWITACPKTLGFPTMISSYLVRKLRIYFYYQYWSLLQPSDFWFQEISNICGGKLKTWKSSFSCSWYQRKAFFPVE